MIVKHSQRERDWEFCRNKRPPGTEGPCPVPPPSHLSPVPSFTNPLGISLNAKQLPLGPGARFRISRRLQAKPECCPSHNTPHLETIRPSIGDPLICCNPSRFSLPPPPPLHPFWTGSSRCVHEARGWQLFGRRQPYQQWGEICPHNFIYLVALIRTARGKAKPKAERGWGEEREQPLLSHTTMCVSFPGSQGSCSVRTCLASSARPPNRLCLK